MIDNGTGTPSANGIGAVAQLVVPPAVPLDAPAVVDASPETLLFRAELLSPDQLGELVQERVVSGRPVEEIVVERGWLDAATVARVLSAGAAIVPALEPHPDPFALPVAEHPAEPLRVAAASFEPMPEQQFVAAEPPSDPFAPSMQHVTVEPVMPEIASFAIPVANAPVETAQPEVASFVLEPTVLEPTVLEPVVLEPVAQEQAAEPSSGGVEFRVSIRFVGNDCVEIASFADAVEAKTAAHALVAQLSSAPSDWPFVGGRFVRPDAVLSVDIDAIVR